jgi:hypothetical protein
MEAFTSLPHVPVLSIVPDAIHVFDPTYPKQIAEAFSRVALALEPPRCEVNLLEHSMVLEQPFMDSITIDL